MHAGMENIRYTRDALVTSKAHSLLKRNKPGRVSCTNTGTTMLHRFVRYGELRKVMADHFGLEFNGIEDLAVIDTDDTSNHFGDDNHVSQVSLNNCRFFVRGSFFLCFAKFLDETHGFSLQASLEPAASACMYEIYKLFVA